MREQRNQQQLDSNTMNKKDASRKTAKNKGRKRARLQEKRKASRSKKNSPMTMVIDSNRGSLSADDAGSPQHKAQRQRSPAESRIFRDLDLSAFDDNDNINIGVGGSGSDLTSFGGVLSGKSMPGFGSFGQANKNDTVRTVSSARRIKKSDSNDNDRVSLWNIFKDPNGKSQFDRIVDEEIDENVRDADQASSDDSDDSDDDSDDSDDSDDEVEDID